MIFIWNNFSCQGIDKNTRINLKTCPSTSSRAQHSVVCAFQRVRLKVNGEATHSQDFLSVGRSVSPRCACRHRACAIERFYARTHARAIAGSCACAHVHLARAQTRASLQINSARACFAFVARRLFSIRSARFFFFRDICRQRTSLSSRCFVFKLDKRSVEGGSRSKAIRIYGFLILFFFFLFDLPLFDVRKRNEIWYVGNLKRGKDRNYENLDVCWKFFS